MSLAFAQESVLTLKGVEYDRLEVQERLLNSEGLKSCVLNKQLIVMQYSTDAYTRWKAEQVINQLALLGVGSESIQYAPAHAQNVTIELFCK